MEREDAILAFAALAQTTRFDMFRLLVAHEPEGLAAGEIARRLAVPIEHVNPFDPLWIVLEDHPPAA